MFTPLVLFPFERTGGAGETDTSDVDRSIFESMNFIDDQFDVKRCRWFLSFEELCIIQSTIGFVKLQNNEIQQRSSSIVRPVQVLATLPDSITPGKSLGIDGRELLFFV